MTAPRSSASTPENTEASRRNEEANAWTLRGIELLQRNTPESLAESLICFDRALELRRDLPFNENPWFLYGFTAGWLNRGDALTRLGTKENLEAALLSYDTALRHLEGLPIEAHPLFRKRRAIAWTNRGITLQKRKSDGDAALAAASFAQALGILRGADEKDPDIPFLRSGILLNQAQALLDAKPVRTGEAMAAAREALALVAGTEGQSEGGAETGLKARCALCRAYAHVIEEGKLPAPEAMKLATESTDLVEEGLRLAKQWEDRDNPRFREPADDLFRFGALVYQAYQPQFLGEYLLENMGGAEDLRRRRAAAMEALWREMRDIQRNIFPAVNTPRYEVYLERLQQLRQGEAELKEMLAESLGKRE